MINQTNNLNKRLLWAVVGGLILGLIIGEGKVASFLQEYIVSGLLSAVGYMFMNVLSMLTIPVILITLVNGIASIGNLKKIGTIGIKAIGYNFITSVIAIGLALLFGYLLKPGVATVLTQTDYTIGEAPTMAQSLIQIIPQNPFKALIDGNLLPIIVFALLVGISIAVLGKKVEKSIELLHQANRLFLKIIQIVMNLAPIGVFALVLNVFIKHGFAGYVHMMRYIGIILGVLIIQFLGVYGFVLKVILKVPLKSFIRKFRIVALTAFATSSSNATVPVTMKTVRDKMGVSNKIASSVIPLGTVVNMDGTAIMQGVAVMFIAQAYQIELTLPILFSVIFYSIMATLAAPGIPGAGLITLSLVLRAAHLPVEGIALVVGVDRILDMARTVVNVSGDMVGALWVAKSENEWNKDIFDDAKAGEVEILSYNQLAEDIEKNSKFQENAM